MDKYEIEGDEVVEREVKPTGNGAHVYVPKKWLKRTVKVVRVPDGLPELGRTHGCEVCGSPATDVDEWCWIDDSGGAYFRICSNCRSEVTNAPQDACAICWKDRERSKSDGFGPIGKDTEQYLGCDSCRARVVFGDSPNPQLGWMLSQE